MSDALSLYIQIKARLLQALTLSTLILMAPPLAQAKSRASLQQATPSANRPVKTANLRGDIRTRSNASRPATHRRARPNQLSAATNRMQRPKQDLTDLRARSDAERVANRVAPRGGGRAQMVAASAREFSPARPSIGEAIGLRHVSDPLDLRSSVAMVIDHRSGEPLYQKNVEAVLPIASITKVMTAMVVLDAGLPLDEVIEISEADRDTERHSSSRLPIGTRLSRNEMLHLALMSSENRAANALGRHFPGGLPAFVQAMNRKALALGMNDSRFSDPTGLSSGNVSNARDLARMVRAAYSYDLIRQHSTDSDMRIGTGRRQITFRSTNRLIRDPQWDIGMQKTGFISEAGKCLVMQARIESRPVIMVLLDADSPQQRFADAQRLKRWIADQPRLDQRTETRS